jgi:GABA permease
VAGGRRPWNPFKSEADAYQLVVVTLGYFGAIVVAAVIDKWAALAVFIVLTLAGIVWLLLRGRAPAPVPKAPRRRDGGDGAKRVLVIANETVAGRRLREEIERAGTGGDVEVLVVCPALNSPLRHWTSDDDNARAQAQERLDGSLERLREHGIEARGEIGDSDPLQAIEDALRTFGPDEIILSTHPPGRSNWLERGVVTGARERFAVPITHVVVDLDAERAGTASA